MNKRTTAKIILTAITIVTGSCSYCFDYFPELGTDPFYSSLNPQYTDPEYNQINEESTVVNWIKKKAKNKKDKTEAEKKKANIKKENGSVEKKPKAKTEKEGLFVTGEKSKSKITKEKQKEEKKESAKPKKKLTRAQLERELEKEEREKQKQKELERQAQEAKLRGEQEEITIKNSLPFFKNKKSKTDKQTEEPIKEPDIELNADYIEYFPERYEAEAIGNAKINFKKNETIIKADRIIYNYDRNTIKATDNVVIISKTTQTEGDYVKIDLNNPDGWMENPNTQTEDIKLSAREAYIYSDKIEEYDGVAKILKEDDIKFGAISFASYLNQGEIINSSNFSANKPATKGVFKLKANTIVIDAKKDHEIIDIKNADLYLKNVKVAKIPAIKIVTNKDHASAETNIPEFGSQSYLGMHIGPAVVLNVPGGSTLKLAPIITYHNDVGIGAIARFRNQSNMTEMAYGTSDNKFLLRGRQKLAPGLMLEYSSHTNQNEWFLGYRRPKYSAQLSYSRADYIEDLGITFSQRYTAGAYTDDTKDKEIRDARWRYRWMTQAYKPLYQYENDEGNVGINAGVATQTAATVYSTGNVTGLARFGPVINTKIGPWNQSIMYFQAAKAGESPFEFDRYRYGRSNFIFMESLRVCKYLTIGYVASLAMNRDYPGDDLLQENRALISIGPDYAKFTLGYDAVRHNTSFGVSMMVGTKDSDIEFKKSVIQNPDNFGKKPKKKKEKLKKKSRKQYLKQIEAKKTTETSETI